MELEVLEGDMRRKERMGGIKPSIKHHLSPIPCLLILFQVIYTGGVLRTKRRGGGEQEHPCQRRRRKRRGRREQEPETRRRGGGASPIKIATRYTRNREYWTNTESLIRNSCNRE